uniref:Uncharacterized protein n=1 Tax=Knipowitschia caucasica TaxID=637954 RepID=A0AAV2L6M5_KNICA
MDFEVEGVKIPEKGVVIVKDDCSTHPLLIGMNVIGACWDAVFKQGKPALSPKRWESQQVWREAFAVCRRTIATPPGDGFLGYVRPASRRPVRVPPKSEILVWGRTTSGPCGADYAAVLEAMPEAEAWGIARTLSVVRGGRVPVRVCNPQLYPVYIGRYQKLGRLYHVEEADVQGARDLSLTMGPDGVVEVGLVDTPDSKEEHTEEGVNKLVDCPHLTHQQQLELQALLQKWRKVFATNEEDFGRTDLVQHRIHTADAPPTKERFPANPSTELSGEVALLTAALEMAPTTQELGLHLEEDWRILQGADCDIHTVAGYRSLSFKQGNRILMAKLPPSDTVPPVLNGGNGI